jgi:hypothetical protein
LAEGSEMHRALQKKAQGALARSRKLSVGNWTGPPVAQSGGRVLAAHSKPTAFP